MAVRPSGIVLIGESLGFVRDNAGVLMAHMAYSLPAIVVLSIGAEYMALQDSAVKYWAFSMVFAQLYIYACFALGWHRTSLRGPDAAHRVNPLFPGRGNAGFIATFLIIIMVPFMVGLISGALLGIATALGSVVFGIALLVILPAMAYIFLAFLRSMFILPGRSVGVRIYYREAKQASRGLIWTLLWSSGVIWMVGYPVTMLAALLGGLVVATVGGSDMTALFAGGTYMFDAKALAAMILLRSMLSAFAFALMAANITLLSRLYSWGMAHNGAVQG